MVISALYVPVVGDVLLVGDAQHCGERGIAVQFGEHGVKGGMTQGEKKAKSISLALENQELVG